MSSDTTLTTTDDLYVHNGDIDTKDGVESR